MLRTLTVLTAVACLAAPVFASHKKDSKKAANTDAKTKAHENRSMDSGTSSFQPATGGAGGGVRGGDRSDRMLTGPGHTALLINPYPAYERRLPASAYRTAYRLTPGEYYRMRASGFTPDEVYMIANASRVTGLAPQVFADGIYRGMYAREFSVEYGLTEGDLTSVLPEWRTPEWGDATGDGPVRKKRLGVWF
jgi:hypothetical protein